LYKANEKQRDAVQEVNIGLRGFPRAFPKPGFGGLQSGRDAVRRISEPRRGSAGQLSASWANLKARRGSQSQLWESCGKFWKRDAVREGIIE
jgi:hypothetical protein